MRNAGQKHSTSAKLCLLYAAPHLPGWGVTGTHSTLLKNLLPGWRKHNGSAKRLMSEAPKS